MTASILASRLHSRVVASRRSWGGRFALKPLALALLGAFPLAGLGAPPPPPPVNAVPKALVVGWRVTGVGAAAPVNLGNAAGGVDQTVGQTSKTGIYNWQSFDIGRSSSVTFNFQTKDSSALNRVTGSATPSQIFGSLKSQYADSKGGTLIGGTVYLVNSNGILFGTGAQVNVGSLVASTLDLSNTDYLTGFANSIAGTSPSFTWNEAANGLFSKSDNFVRVDPGASITTASGGRVFLFAKKVDNAGTIATPDGQTVLAAGSEVYLQDPTVERLYASEANPLYPVVTGLLVEVGKGDGTVTNQAGGTIESMRGNTTLVGMAVNQLGRISASTSVSQDGSVFLLARGNSVGFPDSFANTKRATASGTLMLGAGSSIEIAPDTVLGKDGKPATSDGNAIFTTSRVELAGKTIEIQSGARIVAHGGIVNARADATPYYQDPSLPHTTPYDPTAFTGDDSARLVVGDKAVIDVSGTTSVTVSAARNFVTTALIGKADLKDAPLQKDGPLYRSKLTFDLRQPVAILGDTSAYATAIQRTVEERLARGGGITLTSTGAIVTNAGSALDVSGGQVRYTDALVDPTRLIGADGNRYTLDQAPKDIVFIGLEGASTKATLDRWGVVPQYVPSQAGTGRLEQGYIDGQAGGSLTVVAPHSILDGQIRAQTVAGVRQNTGLDPFAPAAAVNLGLRKNGTDTFGDTTYVTSGLRDLAISAQPKFLPDAFWSDPLAGVVPAESRIAARTINDSGVGKLTITTDGAIAVEQGADIALAPRATLDLAAAGAAGISVGGGFRAEGGTFTARTLNLSGLNPRGPTRAGAISLQPGVSIDVSGDWVNRALDGATAAAATRGGSVTLASARALVLEDSSRIDVSGGATVATGGAVKGTDSGSITLESDVARAGGDRASRIHLGADIEARSLAGGGTLALRGLDAIDIVGAAIPRGVRDGAAPGSLVLSAQFFGNGAFANYDVRAANTLLVDPGVSVAPRASNWILTPAASTIASGTPISSFLGQGQLIDSQRKPVGVSLAATNTFDTSAPSGDLMVGTGAQIAVDPLASVTLTAGLNLDLQGRIRAPGGNVTLALKDASSVNGADLTPATGVLRVGANATIDVSGITVLQPQTAVFQQGSVVKGGNVDIEVTGKNARLTPLQILDGAVIAADGASARLGVSQTTASGTVVAGEQMVSSDGGSVRIVAEEGGATLAGAMHARGGDANASAGSFTLQLAGLRKEAQPGLPAINLVSDYSIVVQDAPVVRPEAVPGSVQVSSRTLEAGFADVMLASLDRIRFVGDVNLAASRNLTLDAPLVNASPQSRQVNLSAGSVLRIGSTPSIELPTATTPIGGPTSLALNGGLVEFYGSQGYLGFKSIDATATSEIRLHGVTQNSTQAGRLSLQSDLVLSAPQVSVTSNSNFTIDAPGKSVLITGGDPTTAAPLFAGGAITINARDITTRNPVDAQQVGVLRAPLGNLSLNASESIDIGAGSVLSVAGQGTVLFGTTTNGTAWTYNSQGVDRPAAKTIDLNARSVNVRAGAVIDVSGGSDLVATEFVAGAGGSSDIFAGAAGGAFAIVPTIKAFAPQDSDTLAQRDATGATASAQLGRQITIGEGAPIPAGTYSLLPARYALLPGTFLVRPVASPAPLVLGAAMRQQDGSVIVGGRLGDAGTGTTSSVTQSFQILTSAQAETRSEVRQTSANIYFAKQADAAGVARPRLPQDAGRIDITADQLALKGTTKFAVADKSIDQGGELDISATRIRVGNGGTAPEGVLALDTTELNATGAAVLVLGGTRIGNALTATASEVVVDNAGKTLQAADLVLLANDRVELVAGSSLGAIGVGSAGATLQLTGNGALVRVSADPAAATVRSGATRARGDLVIGAAAHLSGGAITAEATHATTVAQNAQIAAVNVTFGASRVAVGDVGSATLDPATLVFAPALAAQLGNSQSLTLRSFDGIDFYGTTTLGGPAAQALTLDAGRVSVIGAGQATVQAGDVTLVNTSSSDSSTGGGTGSLRVIATGASGGAGRITIGPGNVSVSGSRLSLEATHEVLLSGQAVLATSGDLAVHAAGLQATQGASAALSARGNFTLDSSGTTAASADSGAGARLQVDAGSIEQAGRIALPSGSITLNAALGNVHFAAGSTTDVAGRAKTFDGVTVATSGGDLRASSAAGNVVVDGGAMLDVSAASSGTGGGAGRLAISASSGNAVIAGTLRGISATGQVGGSLAIDSAAPVDLNRLSNTVAASAGNFSESIDVRNRTGDQRLDAAGPGLAARHISLSADSGSLDVAGKLDASGASGTTVTLSAANTLSLLDGASISAHSSGAVGGEVRLMSGTLALDGAGGVLRNGQIRLNGGQIDTSALAGGSDGSVLIRAQRSDDGSDVRVGKAAGSAGTSLIGATRIEVEAVKQYLASVVDSTVIAQVNADNAAFAGAGGANAAAIRGRIGALLAPGPSQQVQLRSGVEVDQVDPGSDLVVTGSPIAQGWNLTGFDALGRAVAQGTGAPVNLTLRSAGDLLVTASISDGFTAGGASANASSKIAPSAAVAQVGGAFLDGGRIHLVGGADLGSANVMSTQSSTGDRGNVTIGADNKDVIVRTTTGTIDVAAGLDVVLTNDRAAVYTTGKPVDAAGYVGKVFLQSGSLIRVGGVVQSPTLTGGGSVSVQAGRDVVGSGSIDGTGQYGSDWLWRGLDAATNGQATWWTRYDLFRQGIATFGGGNVTIGAGRDAVEVEASAASSGYVARDAAGKVAGLRRGGGGDLVLRSGRDVLGGFLLEDAGSLTVNSGRDIVSPRIEGAPALQVLHGDSRIDIESRNDADIGLVTSFGLITGAKQGFLNAESRTLTGVAAGATLRAVAAAGDLGYRGVAATDIADNGQHSAPTGADKIVPDSATFAAPAGSVSLGTTIQVSAGSTRIDVLAEQNAAAANLLIRGTDPRQASPTLIDSTQAGLLGSEVFRDLAPLDQGARDPVRIVAAKGDVTMGVGQIVKPMRLIAGRDVLIDQSMTVQHQADNELTLVEAGRDILFAFTNNQAPDLKVYGPGDLLVVAGRNVDLKTSGGIGALGNRENASLPDRGAAVTVLAGVSLGGADYARSVSSYFQLLGGTGVAGFAPDLAAQLHALQAGQGLPQLGSSAAQMFKAAPIDQQIAQTTALVGKAAFDATVLSDARHRNTLASQPLPVVDQPAADKAFEMLSSAEKYKVVGAALAVEWSRRLTTQQQHDTVLAMAATRSSDTSYAKSFVSFSAVQSGRSQNDLKLADALDLFEALPRERQALFTNQVLVSEIRRAGRAASLLTGTKRETAYAQAYDALATVFPDAGIDGNLMMGSSQVHTFQDSAIAVLTPRGGVNVGEVAASAGIAPKPANSLGVVTAAGGDISIVVRDSVLVNQSRVFTVGQGDLLMWASKGDLDAGRGAKTITGAPPPVFRIDSQGNFVIDTSGSFFGSGIAVLNADSTLDLYAPKGEINAGDAGIKSLGNAFFGAARFVGADNLNIGGVAVGAPPPASTGGGTAGLASVGQAATTGATRINPDDSEEEKERKRRRRLNLILDFLGFGDSSTAKP